MKAILDYFQNDGVGICSINYVQALCVCLLTIYYFAPQVVYKQVLDHHVRSSLLYCYSDLLLVGFSFVELVELCCKPNLIRML